MDLKQIILTFFFFFVWSFCIPKVFPFLFFFFFLFISYGLDFDITQIPGISRVSLCVSGSFPDFLLVQIAQACSVVVFFWNWFLGGLQ